MRVLRCSSMDASTCQWSVVIGLSCLCLCGVFDVCGCCDMCLCLATRLCLVRGSLELCGVRTVGSWDMCCVLQTRLRACCICRAGRGRLGAGLGTGVAVFGVWRLHPETRFERSEERGHCDFSCDVCSCTVMCGALCINWSIILLEVVHRRTRVTTDIRLKRRMSIRCQDLESRMTCARPGSGVCLPVCGVRET